MMKRITSIAIVAACFLPSWQAAAEQDNQQIALAQSGGQAPGTIATPTTPQPPASGATPAPLEDNQAPMSAATFIERARAGNAFEIESSRLAADKATQPALKTFARLMIDDHSRADKRLAGLAADRGQTEAPVTMEPRQQRSMESLQNATGAEFDRLYASAQLEAHQMAVQLYQSYAETGTDEKLRAFARETLPVLQGHLKQIQNLNQ